MRNRPGLTAVLGLSAAMALLAGCHSSAKSAISTSTTPTAALGQSAPAVNPSGGTDSGAGTLSSAHLRIANFYTSNGQPGPGLDIYDVPLQGSAATPILTNVAYGTVSNYVQPHQLLNNIQKGVQLSALPTGESPVTQKGDATVIGGLLDDGSNAEATILVSASGDSSLGGPTSLLGSMQFTMRMEKGDDGQGGKGPAAPLLSDGSGEILVDTTTIPLKLSPSLYLMIDDSCAPPVNGDPNEKGVPYIFAAGSSAIQSEFTVFATTAGTHQVSVVAWTSSDTPTCKQLTDRQGATSVDVTANQQVELYVYGSSLTALHLATGPIQP
jgi:hypothetical protein